MGCGSSGHVVSPAETNEANGKMDNGNTNTNGAHHGDHDDLPTVMLPDTPKPKPPVAYEIPLEEFKGNKRSSPPPHLQRLLLPPAAEISLPDIKEKLAEAEQRRLLILQQRAASAQKRAQRMAKSFNDNLKMNNVEESKHTSNTFAISPEPISEDKNI